MTSADSDRSTLSVTAYDRSDERSGDQFKSLPTTLLRCSSSTVQRLLNQLSSLLTMIIL